MKPKLQSSKDLKKIVSRLTHTTEKNLIQKLDEWYETYKDFLDEKSVVENFIILIQELELHIEV